MRVDLVERDAVCYVGDVEKCSYQGFSHFCVRDERAVKAFFARVL